MGAKEIPEKAPQNPIRFSQFGSLQFPADADVRAVAQDDLGYIWIATETGIQRFDGYVFQDLNDFLDHPVGMYSSISIHKLHNGHMIFRGDWGFLEFDPVSRNYWHFPGYGLQQAGKDLMEPDPHLRPLDFFELENGNYLVFTTSSLIFEVSGRDKKLSAFTITSPSNGSPDPPSIHRIYEVEPGVFWIRTLKEGKLIEFNAQTREFRKVFGRKGRFPGYDYSNIQWVKKDSRGIIWLSPYRVNYPEISLIKIDPGPKGVIEEFKMYVTDGGEKKVVRLDRFAEDQAGNKWFPSHGFGLFELAPDEKSFCRFVKSDQKGSISSNFPRDVICTSSGLIWIATRGGFNYALAGPQSSRFVPFPLPPNKQFEKYPNAFLEMEDGRIWVGNWNGGGIAEYSPEFEFIRKVPIPLPYSHLTEKMNVWQIFEDWNQNIWISSMHYGRIFMQNPSGVWQTLDSLGSGFPVTDFVQIDSNHIWFIKWDGVWGNIDVNSLKVTSYRLYPRPKRGRYPFKLIPWRDNLLAILGEGRIRLWNRKTESFEQPRTGPLYFDMLEGIKLGQKLILGGNDGFATLSETTDSLQEFKGMSADFHPFIRQMIADSQGKIWAISSNKLISFQPDFTNFEVIDPFRGGFDESVGGGKMFCLKSGKIILGAIDGFFLFDPQNYHPQIEIPVPQVIKFQCGKQQGSSFSKDTPPLGLPAEPNSAYFSLGYPETIVNGSIHFEYRLNEDEWVSLEEENTVALANLPGGNYQLQFRAKSTMNQFSEPLTIPLTVDYKYYQKTPFRIFSFLLALAILALIFYQRIRAIRIKQRIREEIIILQRKALSAQMNPHFIFNCMNSINNYVISNDARNASLFLSRFARLIRRVLESSEKNLVSLEDDLETLKAYLDMERMRMKDTFDYDIELDRGLDPAEFLVPPLLFQPFVENAIWHGLSPKKGGGQLKIELKEETGRLKVNIEDNGVGRDLANSPDEAATRLSLGMKITSDRIHLLMKRGAPPPEIHTFDLRSSNGTPRGTRIEISFPPLKIEDYA